MYQLAVALLMIMFFSSVAAIDCSCH